MSPRREHPATVHQASSGCRHPRFSTRGISMPQAHSSIRVCKPMPNTVNKILRRSRPAKRNGSASAWLMPRSPFGLINKGPPKGNLAGLTNKFLLHNSRLKCSQVNKHGTISIRERQQGSKGQRPAFNSLRDRHNARHIRCQMHPEFLRHRQSSQVFLFKTEERQQKQVTRTRLPKDPHSKMTVTAGVGIAMAIILGRGGQAL